MHVKIKQKEGKKGERKREQQGGRKKGRKKGLAFGSQQIWVSIIFYLFFIKIC